jgi:magnesium transporter
MTYELVAAAVRAPMDESRLERLRAFLMAEHPADVAKFVSGLKSADAWAIFDLLPIERQAAVFGYLAPENQVNLAETAPRAKLARIVTEMNSDERADLFNELSLGQQAALLPALAHAEREDIRRLAGYAEGTAGAMMTSDYATLTEELTAAEALDKLRLEAPDKETIDRAYVIDADRRLQGSVRLQDLILAPPSARVGALMDRNTLAIPVDEKQEQAARRIARYDVIALPVVDSDGRLVGIITYDDAMDVIEEEATEDFHRVGASRMVENLRSASVLLLYRARITWLVLLVFGNIFSGAGIAYFEDTISAHVALVFFLPLLIDSGGNAGSQSATLMVRSLATGDVQLADWVTMLGREVAVAALMGLTMAAAVSLVGLARAGPEIALVVSASMVLIVIVGSVIGMTLPFLLTRLKLDPATASAPLITSIADIAGVLIYFTVATTFLLRST